jgi:hypothetical protein
MAPAISMTLRQCALGVAALVPTGPWFPHIS